MSIQYIVILSPAKKYNPKNYLKFFKYEHNKYQINIIDLYQ